MKLSNYPILRLLIPFLWGIFLTYEGIVAFSTPLFSWVIAVVSLLLSVLFALVVASRHRILPTMGLFISAFFLGVSTTHFFCFPERVCTLQNRLKNDAFWTVHILEKPSEREKSVRLMVKIESDLQGQPVQIQSLLYLKKSKAALSLRAGDALLVHTKFSSITPPQNPYSFDNQKYMMRKSIFFTAYAPTENWRFLHHYPSNPIRTFAAQLQQKFSRLFAESGMQGTEYSIITAILLGDDETMEPELKAHYASAGVSHILCVSGMHLGIIFMIINFLLKPLDLSPKLRILKSVILLLAIWFYAHITGLAPSVKRAATMFSFVILGELLHRSTNVFHSLFASMFILLLFNPLLLFEIGFQMSYLAVFGIVVFQPKISALFQPKSKIINYFWELACVSIAAQLATSPLSIYYFGQFPNYFLLSNLSVIALSFGIVVTGVVLLITSWIPIFSKLISGLLTLEVRLMNNIVNGIESLPGSVTENIALTSLQMMLIYGIVIAIFFTFFNKKKWLKYLSLCLLFAFSITLCYGKIMATSSREITIYSMNKMTAVTLNDGGQGTLLLDSLAEKDPISFDFNIKNHLRMKKIAHTFIPLDTLAYARGAVIKMGDFIQLGNRKLYVLSGRQRLYPSTPPKQVDVILLRDNPRIPMHKLLQCFNCKQIVLDGTNSNYQSRRWIDSCAAYQIPCHITCDMGYFSLSEKF